MKKLCVRLAVFMLRFINLFLKPCRLRRKVAILSRQSDTPSVDIRLLAESLEKAGIETAVVCKALDKSLSGAISFGIGTIRQMYHIATSKVVVVDSYCIPVSVLPKKQGQKVIQTWHALGAIKTFGWQNIDKIDGHSHDTAIIMNMHGNYDYVLAPCAITGEHYAKAFRTPIENIVRMGLPRIDFIREEDPKMREKIEGRYPKIREKCNVLYVPTYRKHAELGLEKLIAGFDFSSMNLIIKKHFLDKGDYTWAEEKGAIVDMEFASLDWMKICDKVISDYSAISFEASILEKELFIFQPDINIYASFNGLNVNMHKEAIGEYVCETEEELFRALAKPYDKQAVREFRDKFLDIDRNDCTGQLRDFIISLL